jgi:uncharacterized lipoprotein YddW (UPF0748 family)
MVTMPLLGLLWVVGSQGSMVAPGLAKEPDQGEWQDVEASNNDEGADAAADPAVDGEGDSPETRPTSADDAADTSAEDANGEETEAAPVEEALPASDQDSLAPWEVPAEAGDRRLERLLENIMEGSPASGQEADTGPGAVEDNAAPLVPPGERPGRRPSDPVELPTPRQRAPLPTTPPPWQQPAVVPDSPATADPAEQVAPALIEITPQVRILSPFLSLAMQQELRELMGRFESAWLMENSLDMTTTLAVADPPPVLTAAAEDVNLQLDRDGFLHPALADAQGLLDDWDELIANEEYQQAQDRWVAAREALWEQFPAERPFAQAEIRAVWLDRGTIVAARSAAGLTEIFDQLADAGITTVFFETVNAGYPIYPSQVAPQQNPLIFGWDPLQIAVELAHERHMTLHAWVWVFAAGNERHNRLLNLPADYPGPLLAQHPDWAGYDNTGNRIPPGQDKPFLDPANPEVRSYLTRLMTEIVQQYEVDGVQLDYIRYPFQDPGANRTYGYGEVARWRFRSISGVDPLNLSPRPDPALPQAEQMQQRILWDRWTEFRVHQVNSFVETVSTTLRRYRPDLIVSAAVFAKPEHERLQKIQQDWGTWARNGYVDWIVLMSYAEDTSRFSQMIDPWLVEETFPSTLVIPGIRLLNLADSATMDQIQVTRDLPTPGYALFAAADLDADLTTILTNTQSYDGTWQSPFQLALGRYQALQREWHWLLSQDRLWMERGTLNPWIEAANRLGQDLQGLAEAPTQRQLATVKAGFEAVRTPLNDEVLIESANSSYRLQSWQHRLMAIEQLLTYGERTEF